MRHPPHVGHTDMGVGERVVDQIVPCVDEVAHQFRQLLGIALDETSCPRGDVCRLDGIKAESGWYETWLIDDVIIPKAAEAGAGGHAAFGLVTRVRVPAKEKET